VGKNTVLPSNVLSVPLVGKNKGHPAVFPVDLPMFFIKLLSPENGFIVDPFGGSGTTGIAALIAERNCVLIDNNYEYCCAAANRLMAEADAALGTELLQGTLYDRQELVRHIVVKDPAAYTNHQEDQ